MGLLVNEVRDKVVLTLMSSGLSINPRFDKLDDPEAIKEADELRKKYDAGEPIMFRGEIRHKFINKDEENQENKKTSFWKKLFGH